MILLSSEVSADDDGVSAESLWIELKGESKSVVFAQLVGGEWQDESPIYETTNAMTSLAMGTAPSGEKLVVWTEKKRLKTELMYMTASELDGLLVWSDALPLHNKGHENFSASVVYDPEGIAWLFWASTTENYSDIVLRKFDGSWGDVERVHSNNTVPDIKPSASITELGEVLVEWVSYDFKVGGYADRARRYTGAPGALDRASKILVDKVIPSDVQLPPNMYTDALALVHFPTNQKIQSVLYKQGFSSN